MIILILPGYCGYIVDKLRLSAVGEENYFVKRR